MHSFFHHQASHTYTQLMLKVTGESLVPVSNILVKPMITGFLSLTLTYLNQCEKVPPLCYQGPLLFSLVRHSCLLDKLFSQAHAHLPFLIPICPMRSVGISWGLEPIYDCSKLPRLVYSATVNERIACILTITSLMSSARKLHKLISAVNVLGK